jgi:cytochrome c553
MGRRWVTIGWCAAALLPLLAHGVSTSRQEFLEALHSTPNLDRGAQLFDTCAACHGASGAGTRDGAVPRIAGQHAAVIAKQLVDFRYDRRWELRMEHFTDQHHLADAQAIADVAAYINQLRIHSTPGVGPGDHIGTGAALYARQCQSCHGRSGEGIGKSRIPRLAGQHYEYLVRQIHDAVEGRRPNFSDSHVRLLARLQDDDIAALAQYLSGATGAE